MLPRFEKRDGQYIVHYAGREWGLLTWPRQSGTIWYEVGHGYHTHQRVGINFDLVALPPRDLSIPDNIILGDN